MAFPTTPQGSDRNDSGCTDISEKRSGILFKDLIYKHKVKKEIQTWHKKIRGRKTQTYPLSQLAGAPEVHYFNGASLGVTEQDVLWLEVTVDDAELRGGEKQQCCTQLLSKLPGQVQRNSSEVCIS